MSNRTPAGDKGTADRIEADDGGYWVRLVTWQALDREGACMNHCVGDGTYDDLVGGENLNDEAIWSLRDRDGLSILTVRIQYGGLDYAKGPSNHQPGRGASMQVRHLVAAFKAAGFKLEVSAEETGIVLLEDGRTFRRDRLPPEVQAQIQERDARRWGHRHSLSSGQYEVGPATILARPANAPPGTPFTEMGFGAGGFGDPAFDLTRCYVDPVIRVFHLPHDMGRRYVTRTGVQFDVRPDVLSASGPSGAEFLLIYLDAVRGAARDRPPERGAPMGLGGGGGGQAIATGRPTGWATILREQAAEPVSYGVGPGGGGQAVRTVAIGVDTQPAPAVETSTDVYGPFVEHVKRHLIGCLGLSYEEFARDWRATAERAELALIAERARGGGLSSIPGLQVTFAGGGSSGFTRATATPPSPGA